MDAPTRKYGKTELVTAGGMLVLRFPYDRVRVDVAKRIPGCTFREDLGGWAAPLGSIRPVLDWCREFSVSVPPHVEALVGHVEFLEGKMVSLSSAISGEHVVVPGLQGELMEHQHVAVQYLVKTRRSFLADDVGVGKTLSAIATLEVAHSDSLPSYPALIIAPPKLVLNWEKEWNRWLPHRTVQVLTKRADSPVMADVTIVGNSLIFAMKDDLYHRGFRSVVLDESHAMKTATAQRTKAAKQITRGKPTRKVAGETEGGAGENPILLALSGTPITIRPKDYVPQLEIIDRLDDFGGDKAFYRTFCDARITKDEFWIDGASNLELLNRQLRMTCYVRRERTDVLTDLPPAVHSDLLVPLDGKWMGEYQKAEADVVQYLVERAKQIALELGADVHSAGVRARMRAEAAQHLIKISVLRKISGMGKVEFTKEWTQDRLDEGRQLILAAHHQEVVNALADEFGGCKIQGGMTAGAVEEAKSKFQSGAAPVIVVSIEAGKEGHTLTAAKDVGFIEFPWTSTTYDQVWGRAHRNGQKDTVFVTALLGAGTRDVAHFDLLDRRRSTVHTATVGSRDAGPDLVLTLLDVGLS